MKFLLLLLALAATALADTPSAQETISQSKVVVEGMDSSGKVLHSGLGFVWDQNTIICSYAAVRGATSIRASSDGWSTQLNRLISYNEVFDIAVFEAQDEIPQDVELGNSEMLVSGNSVFYFSRDKEGWHVQPATVKAWAESGSGYEMIRLQTQQIAEASPVYNSSANVVGWVLPNSTAVPLKAIDALMQQKSAALLLPEVSTRKDFWDLKLRKPTATAKDELELSEYNTVRGPDQFPFHVDLPVNWQTQTSTEPSRCLMRAADSKFGISTEVRVVPVQTDDLRAEVERVEIMLFPQLSRNDLQPFSSDHFTGFKARYENDQYSASVFYAMSGRNLYIAAVTSPHNYSEEIEPLISHIFASLR